MIKKDITLVSDYDGLKMQGIVYEPENTPKGIVQLVHGMCEYKKRYEEVMGFLAENGYISICFDLRGHGDSLAQSEDLGWFNDFHGKAVVDDCVQVAKWAKETYPGLPFTLLGHSMGSMVVRSFSQEHDDLVDKLVVSGSPTSNPMAGVAVLLAKTIRLFRGQRHRSKMLAFLATGKGKKAYQKAGKGSWLTHDEKIAQAYEDDDFCGFTFTVNGFENLFNLMKCTYTKRGYRMKNPALPIHFISGSEDVVLGGEKNWEKTLAFTRGLGYTNVTGKLYQDMRHEVLNETERFVVYNDLLAFLEK